ncbi:hypothetical protein NQ315_016079 [Exocentrus adspersus]|uniref:DUF4780 domain-containing protein n=1 Tax=Exocentrus adspersus TaxID=1586481 RepID=A0AAV8VL63_9CUCU|nr:hypothetical protein NQ315_016079 [Exocentrus adspersus]
MQDGPGLIQGENCHICEKPFQEGGNPVRDRCHFTEKFRGWIQTSCNLNYKNSVVVPVVPHNLSNYDGHLLIRDIAEASPGKITLLAKNKEKYISFTKRMSESLISSIILRSIGRHTNRDGLNILKSEFSHLNEDSLGLFIRKEADYTHAKTVWRAFNSEDLSQYTQLYLKTDRDRCLKTYGLDPAHYYTLPEYTWDCMLKHTAIKLEYLQDIDILLFFERGIRGGVSQCCNRYAKANNKYMPDYNPNDPSNYPLYSDVNALYSWAMSQYLPYGGFKWVSEIENFDVLSIPNDSDIGYMLEVDLSYPNHLHEHRTQPNSKLSRLMTTLQKKEHYVVHYTNLKQYHECGMKLDKNHRILQFNQSLWLKVRVYVDLNARLRANAGGRGREKWSEGGTLQGFFLRPLCVAKSHILHEVTLLLTKHSGSRQGRLRNSPKSKMSCDPCPGLDGTGVMVSLTGPPAIVELPEYGPQVRFQGCTHRPGWLLITCTDRESATWLEDAIKRLQPWEGAHLKLVEEKDLPKPHICVAYIPKEGGSTAEEVLSLLRQQNRSLNTRVWIIGRIRDRE